MTVASEQDAAGSPGATPRPSLLSDSAHLFALCGFAIAQPLLDLLGKNPTFFVAHDLDGLNLVAFAFALLLIPPLVLLAILSVTRLVSTTAARVARTVMVGLLVALILLPPLERAIGLSTAAWITLAVVTAIAAAIAYDRFRLLRTFLTYLTPAPLLFLAIFVFLTPTHTLLFATDPAAAAVDLQGTRTPVIVIVFDEFPLGILLGDHGTIDATHFPGFARLAKTTTWYPNVTTVSTQTLRAVPAIQTGLLPPEEAVPVASSYPRSLFTLFARSHLLHVSEAVTRLCPRALCRKSNTAGSSVTNASLANDVQTVYLRALLPDATATQWGVPTIGDRWAGFGHVTATTSPTRAAPRQTPADFDHKTLQSVDSQDQAARFEAFLASLGTGRSPGLWFLHCLLPHVPYALLPDGRPYNARYVPRPGERPSNADLVHLDAERLVLQTMRVDDLVDRLLGRLERTGLLEDALVVVTADHGVALVPGKGRREVDDAQGRDGVLPVPLFVKYPGQTTAEVDRRDARTIDVVPTIVDALGIDVPADWHFDGRSLAGTPRKRHARTLSVDGTKLPASVNARRIAAELDTFLVSGGGPHDGFRIGPYGELVGEPVASLMRGSPVGSVHADHWAAYDDIGLDGVLPALFEATVTGVEPGQWVAVALNGTIAGVGPVYQLDDTGDTRVVAMLDPSFMRAHTNTLDVYRIDSTGTTLHPLAPRR